MLEQLKSDLKKKTINWKKCEPKTSVQAPNPYLNYLISPRFQSVNKLFLLLFEKKRKMEQYTQNIIFQL